MPGYIIARHSSILSNTGLCQATSSRGTAAFSATPAYAKLHHLGPVVLPRVPLLVGVDQGEELTHSLLGRLPTTHLLQTLRNPWEPRSAMDLRAGLAQGQSTGLLPRAQAAFWCGKPCLAESHVGI